MADGIVNGCGVKDPEASLRIGDLNEKPLREIISTRNPAYMKLIGAAEREVSPGLPKLRLLQERLSCALDLSKRPRANSVNRGVQGAARCKVGRAGPRGATWPSLWTFHRDRRGGRS